jgi:hypothetical protein
LTIAMWSARAIRPMPILRVGRSGGLEHHTARVIIIPVDRLVRALVRLVTDGQLAARIPVRCAS